MRAYVCACVRVCKQSHACLPARPPAREHPSLLTLSTIAIRKIAWHSSRTATVIALRHAPTGRRCAHIARIPGPISASVTAISITILLVPSHSGETIGSPKAPRGGWERVSSRPSSSSQNPNSGAPLLTCHAVDLCPATLQLGLENARRKCMLTPR